MRGFRGLIAAVLVISGVAIAAASISRSIGYFAGVVCGSVATEAMRSAG